MVRAVKEGRDVDLNEIKKNACVRYSLAKAPKLVEIIAAVPDEMVRDAREEERREEERK
jgi:elongator complex protein 3